MDHRLPRSILPINYAVEIAPDRDQGRFSGSVTVQAEVATETSELRLSLIHI